MALPPAARHSGIASIPGHLWRTFPRFSFSYGVLFVDPPAPMPLKVSERLRLTRDGGGNTGARKPPLDVVAVPFRYRAITQPTGGVMTNHSWARASRFSRGPPYSHWSNNWAGVRKPVAKQELTGLHRARVQPTLDAASTLAHLWGTNDDPSFTSSPAGASAIWEQELQEGRPKRAER
jgi:hypothetical protein